MKLKLLLVPFVFGGMYLCIVYANPQKNSFPATSIIGEQIAPTSLLSAKSTDDILQSFLQPIHFTRLGINTFFTTIFNSSLYSERFLGSCFVHIIDFLDYGKNNNKPASYYESVFLLFHHRLKENNWVNPYALLMLLDQLPDYIGYMPEHKHALLVDTLKAELEQAFISFKKEEALQGPTYNAQRMREQKNATFYTQTAERLVMAMEKIEQEGTIRDIQRSLVLLLESMLNKVVFNPKEHDAIWKTMVLLAQKCEHIYNIGCLAHADDLNRLIWSLLYRFGYFIECMGQQLPRQFYQDIRQSLITDPVLFLHREEQEEWLTTKMDYLNTVLSKGEILSHAYTQGILTDR